MDASPVQPAALKERWSVRRTEVRTASGINRLRAHVDFMARGSSCARRTCATQPRASVHSVTGTQGMLQRSLRDP